MTAEALVSELQARGITLEAHGDRLRIRPSTMVTPEEVERLRALKPEILDLLTSRAAVRPQQLPALDQTTIREILGATPDPHDLAILTFDVLKAVGQLEAEIQSGRFGPAPLLVRGRPLGDWLDLGDVARLLRQGKAR